MQQDTSRKNKSNPMALVRVIPNIVRNAIIMASSDNNNLPDRNQAGPQTYLRTGSLEHFYNQFLNPIAQKHRQFTNICHIIIVNMNQGLYFGQMVIGPAGSGKSTYCQIMQEMAETLKRNIVIFNLDPAAEYNSYRCDFDIKELITLEDAMEEMQLGPNGALLFCMEYLLQNQSWLEQKLNEFVKQDDYVLFDCPGQIELYSDQDIFRQLVKVLQHYGFSLISMYMMDVNFIFESNKFLSGTLQALSIQITLELPAITVLTKCDLMKDKEKLDQYLNYFSIDNYEQGPHQGDSALYGQIRKIIDNNDVVSIRGLNLKEQDSIRDLLMEADHAIQYGENLEPNDYNYEKAEERMNQDMQWQ